MTLAAAWVFGSNELQTEVTAVRTVTEARARRVENMQQACGALWHEEKNGDGEKAEMC
jgi:hypothetical protein